ncbi:MAG: hypothetical protein MJZ73_03460 [Bacteroidaceae bacterium]|nr:hypothetical protein [Bacteroidaceae bacterium]
MKVTPKFETITKKWIPKFPLFCHYDVKSNYHARAEAPQATLENFMNEDGELILYKTLYFTAKTGCLM